MLVLVHHENEVSVKGSKLVVLNFDSVDGFVREQRKQGSDVRWDGWDLVFWKPSHYGFSNKNGAFRRGVNGKRGRWGVETRVTVNGDGLWKVPSKNVKHS